MKNLIEIEGDVWNLEMIMMIGIVDKVVTVVPCVNMDETCEYTFNTAEEAQTNHIRLVKAWKNS